MLHWPCDGAAQPPGGRSVAVQFRFCSNKVLGFKRNVAGPGSFTKQSQNPDSSTDPADRDLVRSATMPHFHFFFLDLLVRRIFPNSVQWQLDLGVFLPPEYPRQSFWGVSTVPT